MMPLHHFKCGSGQPYATQQRPSNCLSAPWGTALAFNLEVGGLDLGQAVVISEKEKRRGKKKKEPMCLEEKHLLACETLLAFRLRGLWLIRLRVAPLPRARTSWAACWKGKEKLGSGTAWQSHKILHGTWEPACWRWGAQGQHRLTPFLFLMEKDTVYQQAELWFKESPTCCLNSKRHFKKNPTVLQ